MSQIPKFKCRASMVGKIMTDPIGKGNYDKYLSSIERVKALKERYDGFKDKNGKTAIKIKDIELPNAETALAAAERVKDVTELSETCKTYLKEWIISKKYGRKKEFTSKQTDKGNATEQDGFDVIQNVLYKDTFLSKCTKYYEDDFKCGNPDVIVEGTVIDNKSSYTIFTFPFAETEIKNKDNIWQIHTYMDLAKLKKGKVCYTLNDTPQEIVDGELRAWLWKHKEYEEIPEAIAYEIIKPHVYTLKGLKEYGYVLGTFDTSDFVEIPIKKRIVSFDFEYNRDLIERINLRVTECDEWVRKNWDKF